MKRIFLLIIFILFLSGCEAQNNEDLTPPDTLAPTMVLSGDSDITLVVGDTYIDQGVAVVDDRDRDPLIITSGLENIDTTIPGRYYVYYNAIDESGNQSQELTRTVRVVNKEPGIITSFVYESDTFLGIKSLLIDPNNILDTAEISLYDGDVLVTSLPLNTNDETMRFDNLVSGVDYTVKVSGTYDLGGGNGTASFEKPSFDVGVYRRIDESLSTDMSPEMFTLLQKMVYLPYESYNDTKSDVMIEKLAHVDYEILDALYQSGVEIVLTNGYVTDVYDYFYLRGVDIPGSTDTIDDRPGICCTPTVAKIGYHGTSIDLLLQLIGMDINGMLPVEVTYTDTNGTYTYLDSISYSDEFMAIFVAEAANMFPDDQYSSTPDMYFIEAFAHYYFSDESRANLQEKAPQTYQFMEDLITTLNLE